MRHPQSRHFLSSPAVFQQPVSSVDSSSCQGCGRRFVQNVSLLFLSRLPTTVHVRFRQKARPDPNLILKWNHHRHTIAAHLNRCCFYYKNIKTPRHLPHQQLGRSKSKSILQCAAIHIIFLKNKQKKKLRYLKILSIKSALKYSFISPGVVVGQLHTS